MRWGVRHQLACERLFICYQFAREGLFASEANRLVLPRLFGISGRYEHPDQGVKRDWVSLGWKTGEMMERVSC